MSVNCTPEFFIVRTKVAITFSITALTLTILSIMGLIMRLIIDDTEHNHTHSYVRLSVEFIDF